MGTLKQFSSKPIASQSDRTKAMFRGLLLVTALILGAQADWTDKAKPKSKWYLIETEGEISTGLPSWTTKPPKCEYEDEKPSAYCLKYKQYCKQLDVLQKVCAKTCKC